MELFWKTAADDANFGATDNHLAATA